MIIDHTLAPSALVFVPNLELYALQGCNSEEILNEDSSTRVCFWPDSFALGLILRGVAAIRPAEMVLISAALAALAGEVNNALVTGGRNWTRSTQLPRPVQVYGSQLPTPAMGNAYAPGLLEQIRTLANARLTLLGQIHHFVHNLMPCGR